MLDDRGHQSKSENPLQDADLRMPKAQLLACR